IDIANQLEANGTRLVTTQAILLEIGNALSKTKYRVAAVQLLESLVVDSNVEIVQITNELYDAAFALFKSRQDKEWGLIDCISFTVMKDRKIYNALTADDHFNQAGFRALLKK
ncbi:MAG: PIN domain-containing protein, partial [Leptolyngbyaceae cyanobacterium bins.59]|nr:PIN domain-containing protein [Leptolyngbyaceae cyanobacterium bins.59]